MAPETAAAIPGDKWAILIGIDKYNHGGSQGTKRRSTTGTEMGCPNDLKGGINDVLAVKDYLIAAMEMDPKHIKLLLAPVEGGEYMFKLPSRNEYEEPTYENIVKAVAEVPKYAKPNDLVYIHYSGHAGQATTIFHEYKQGISDGIDHCLLPTNVAYGGRYLRDLEFGALLQDIVASGAVLTVVLDSCHSAGAVRGAGDAGADAANVRGEEDVYQSVPKVDSQLAEAAAERVKRWGRQPRWVEAPRGFVVLAACLEHQKAREMWSCSGDGAESREFWHGRLTYWLLDTLRTCVPGLSSAAIHGRLCAKIQNSVEGQTPYLIGEPDRFFFSSGRRSRVYAVRVSEPEIHQGRVTLAAGRFHGVKKGAEYAILPLDFKLDRRVRDCDVLARVCISEVGSGASKATIIDAPARPGIVGGCPAVLQSLPLRAQATVLFVAAGDEHRRDFEAAWETYGHGRRLLRLLTNEESDDPDFTVTVEDGCFQIKDRSGMLTTAVVAQLRRLRRLRRDASDSVFRLVRRLEHIARYQLLRRLENPCLRAGSAQDLVTVTEDWSPDEEETMSDRWIRPVGPMPRDAGGVYEIPEDSHFRITVTNNGEQPVGCTILNFDAEFGISVVHPDGGCATFSIIHGSRPHTVEGKPVVASGKTAISDDFAVYIPEELLSSHKAGGSREAAAAEATKTPDLFKVLASRPARDAEPLQLLTLREVEQNGYGCRGGQVDDGNDASLNSLDELLSELMPVTRTGRSVRSRRLGAVDWQTKDIFVRALPKLPSGDDSA